MQEALAKHFAPAECLVLGCRLQPFSLWHWRLFDQLDLPLWPGGDARVGLGLWHSVPATLEIGRAHV